VIHSEAGIDPKQSFEELVVHLIVEPNNMNNLALLPTIILLLACTQVEKSDTEVESIRTQLIEIAKMSALDRPTTEMVEEYMQYFAAEPTLLPANGAAIYGRDSIARFYNNAFDGITIISNKYEKPVIVVHGSTATRRYSGTAVFQLAGSSSPATAKNRYVDVLVKEGGEWKMLWHSWVPVTWE
jgi:ketosteroid isomerase-like protein